MSTIAEYHKEETAVARSDKENLASLFRTKAVTLTGIWKASILSGSICFYVLASLFLIKDLGQGIFYLAFLPVTISAIQYGFTGGFLSSLLVYFLYVFILFFTSHMNWMREGPLGGFFELAFLVGSGTAIGWARDFAFQAKVDKKTALGIAKSLESQEKINSLLLTNMTEAMAIVKPVYDDYGQVIDWELLKTNPAFNACFHLQTGQTNGEKASHFPLVHEIFLSLEKLSKSSDLTVSYLSYETGTDQDRRTFKARRIENARDEIAVFIEDTTEEKKAIDAERTQRCLAEALIDIASALNSSLELDDVLNRIMVHIQTVASYDAINIMLVEDGTVRVARYQGYSELGLTEYIESFQRSVDDVPGLKWMKENKKPLVFSDTFDSSSWLIFPATSWIRSYAGIPIMIRGEIIGFLNLNSSIPGFFQPDYVDSLKPFADQCALAIHNARTYRNVQGNERRMAVLNRASGMLNQPVELASILQVSIDFFADALNLEEVELALFDEKREHLTIVASLHSQGRQLTAGKKIQYKTHPVYQYVITHEKPFYAGELRDTGDSDFFMYQIGPSGPADMLLIPLVIGEEVIGTIGSTGKVGRRIDPENFSLAISIANMAAIRIEQARIYALERWRSNAFALLHATSLDLSMSYNQPELLKTIVQRAAWLIKATGGLLYLNNPAKKELRCMVCHNFQYFEEGFIVNHGEGAAGIVVENRKPLIVNDYASWEYRILNFGEQSSPSPYYRCRSY